MRQLATAALALCSICTMCRNASALEKFYYAKVYDRTKNMEYRVLSDDEYKALQEEMKSDARYFTRALMLAAKDWRADESTRKKMFPRSAVAKKKVTVIMTFRDRKSADAKLDAYRRSEAEKATKDKEGSKSKKYDWRTQSGKALGNRNKDRDAKDEEKEAARQALRAQARQLFETKLAELIAAASTRAEASASQ